VSETTQANPSSGRLNYGREIAENFAESGHFHFTFVYFYVPYIYDIDRRLYFPSEGRRTVDFFARKKLI